MASLRLEHVRCRYGGVAALEGIDLEVPDGAFCVVVGPSGCGKSTLLRAVAGLEPVESGAIYIGDEDVTAAAPRDRDVAFVFQNYALYPHMTARQNLEFPLRARGMPAADRERRVRDAAALLRIEPLLDRTPRELSGGERQRVAIGRAVVRRPRVFLFDEPLSNLDARLRARMRVELVELHRTLEVTTVYVTHDQAEAMTLAERVVVLESGRIHQVGAPREIYDRPADLFVAGFVGSPSMNFFAGEIGERGEARTFRAPGAELPVDRALPEGSITLGVRPQDLLVEDGGPIAVRATLVEDLGGECFVHTSGESGPVVYRASTDAPTPKPGDALRLRPLAGKEHWFVDGRRVGS
jgi:ABC-type sugar transport system ATPase subunit